MWAASTRLRAVASRVYVASMWGDAGGEVRELVRCGDVRRPKRALSERSHLIALPEAKASSCSNSNVEIDLQ